MVRLKAWQWVVLALPITGIIGFLAIAAGLQIHQWGMSWIWAVVIVVFVGWRWLLAQWLQPPIVEQVETALAELDQAEMSVAAGTDRTQQAQAELQKILQVAREDAPPWENWTVFFQRCQTLINAIARVYYPQVKRPLLHIYVPQAYRLLRDTVDDVDRWMQQLSPALNQLTIAQAYEAYELYQKLGPATRTALKIWNWSQWLLNPAAALAKTATRQYSTTANQQLVVNLGQLLREQTLKALGMRAIALYSGAPPKGLELPKPAPASTQTLRDILTQADPETLEQKPVNLLLVGRTGAGKSSLINTLFFSEQAAVDVLPRTDRLQTYHWEAEEGELVLWDAPGYEQIRRPDLRELVLDQLPEVDTLLLVTPATDPALQMDLAFLQEAKEVADLPVITIVTHVDRLRPIREWQPPYNWQQGNQPKERSIREAVQYRQEVLGTYCNLILPLVTADSSKGRDGWGTSTLSEALIASISPAKQLRLARFLQDLDARSTAAAKIIERYAFQMSTTQGLAALLKSPVLSFISTLMTGSPALAVLLAEKIPVERSPIVLGKLQMAYELFSLLARPGGAKTSSFDLRGLWPLLLKSAPPADDAWALGHALVEYWRQSLTSEQLRDRYHHYLAQRVPVPTSSV